MSNTQPANNQKFECSKAFKEEAGDDWLECHAFVAGLRVEVANSRHCLCKFKIPYTTSLFMFSVAWLISGFLSSIDIDLQFSI